MQTRRHLELLEVKELNRLMELAVEAACFACGFGQRLVAAYHGLAAECAFELWWRDRGSQDTGLIAIPAPVRSRLPSRTASASELLSAGHSQPFCRASQ
jgi:hypothetical protein